MTVIFFSTYLYQNTNDVWMTVIPLINIMNTHDVSMTVILLNYKEVKIVILAIIKTFS